MGRRGRIKMEPTKIKAIRLPIRICNLLEKASAENYRSVNVQIRKLIEDFLVSEGYMKDEDRGPKKASEIENKGG